MNKFYIRYARNSHILHIRIGRYHILISRLAGIIRNDKNCRDRWIWGT